MTVRAIEPDRGLLDLPGGFLHEDETPEAGGQREANEELGVAIAIVATVGFVISPYGDQGFYVLNIGLHAQITSGQPQPLDEISALEWIDPTTVDPSRLAFTSNRELLALWLQHRSKKSD